MATPLAEPVLIGNGRRLASDGGTFEAVNPATQEVIGLVPRCTVDDANDAVAAARAALPGWRATHPEERARMLREFADAVEADGERLIGIDVRDNGSPITGMRVDIAYGAHQLRYFAGLILEAKGETVNTGWDRLNYTLRQPYGVVLKIIPFNHPIMFLLSRIAAPLAAGNTVIVKPSEATSLSAIAIADHIERIFPPGVVNIVTGFGNEVGRALVTHPEVRRISLVGSFETAKRISEDAARSGIKHVTHELGGKNPIIIWPDAPFEDAIDGVLRGMRYTFQGQACGSTSRLLLHEDIHDEFVDALAERLTGLRIGMPELPETEIGAVVNERQMEKVLSYFEIGREEGTVMVGGVRRTEGELGRGLFVEPTIVARAERDGRLMNEEIFGPVLATTTYSSFEDAMQLANSVSYGLTASFYTRDLGLAHRFARDIEAGFVWVNDNQRHFPGTPFGGWKNSGIGKDEGLEELLSYTQTKNVNVLIPTEDTTAGLQGA